MLWIYSIHSANTPPNVAAAFLGRLVQGEGAEDVRAASAGLVALREDADCPVLQAP